jgi:hypothetical protein
VIKPAGIVMLATVGVAKAVLLLSNATTMGDGDVHSKVTMPFAIAPPTIGLGDTLIDRARIARTVC